MGNLIRPLLRRTPAAIMGIVNITPDSFSDGGQFIDTDAAFKQAMNLVEEGADILDIGGESTRPGAKKVGLQEELDRVVPVIERLAAATNVPLSIDTYKPEVMRIAVDAGASMINDINGLRAEGAMDVVATAQVPVCLMHMQGQPENMQTAPKYQNVSEQVNAFFQDCIADCIQHGIAKKDLILDPGIGFGKNLHHNLELLNSVSKMKTLFGCEVLIGVSRKSLIDQLLGRPLAHRLPASIGLAVQSVINGAKIVRVHDVRATFDAIRAVEAVVQAGLTDLKDKQ